MVTDAEQRTRYVYQYFLVDDTDGDRQTDKQKYIQLKFGSLRNDAHCSRGHSGIFGSGA